MQKPTKPVRLLRNSYQARAMPAAKRVPRPGAADTGRASAKLLSLEPRSSVIADTA
jgi:hypothetical protein